MAEYDKKIKELNGLIDWFDEQGELQAAPVLIAEGERPQWQGNMRGGKE